MTELKIMKERVLAAAKKSSQVEKALKELFPQAFDDGPFYFGESYELSTVGTERKTPLYVGLGNAQHGDELKVLIVSRHFDMEVIKNYHNEQTGLKFTKKTN